MKKESFSTHSIFTKRLKDTREDSDRSQSESAEILHTSREAYGHYERGIRIPNVAFLFNFCATYGVSADYLLGLSNVRLVSQVVSVEVNSKPRSAFSDLSVEQIDKLQKISDLDEDDIDEIIELIDFKLSRKRRRNRNKAQEA